MNACADKYFFYAEFKKTFTIILIFISFFCDAQQNKTDNKSLPNATILNGEIKTHFNERLFSFNEGAEKYYDIKATHFKMRFYRKQKIITEEGFQATKFYKAIYAAHLDAFFHSDSNNLARILFVYSDSMREEKKGLFGIFRPKRENRYTSYHSIMRLINVSLRLKADSIYWKLSWTGVPSARYFDSAGEMNPKELFLVSGNDSVKIVFSAKAYKKKYELKSYNFYHHDTSFATLSHIKNNKYSYRMVTESFGANRQFAYAIISLFCLIYEERDTSFGEDN